jgi:hypothetical protein
VSKTFLKLTTVDGRSTRFRADKIISYGESAVQGAKSFLFLEGEEDQPWTFRESAKDIDNMMDQLGYGCVEVYEEAAIKEIYINDKPMAMKLATSDLLKPGEVFMMGEPQFMGKLDLERKLVRCKHADEEGSDGI